MADDPFSRSIEAIDHDLHEACEKRTKGTDEILHGIFMVERAELNICRLIEERLKVKAAQAQESKTPTLTARSTSGQ